MFGDENKTTDEKLEEIKEWCEKANNGYVLFDASAGMRFASYCMRLLDKLEVLKGSKHSLELQQYAIEEYYQGQIRALKFKCKLLTMVVKGFHPELYYAILTKYDKVYPQQKAETIKQQPDFDEEPNEHWHHDNPNY
jgi:hypothetical protein